MTAASRETKTRTPPAALAERVEALALALGFDRVGVAPPETGPDAARLGEWLARGYAGDMHYLGAREAERRDPRRVLPAAKSVIVVALFHDPPVQPPVQPPVPPPDPPPGTPPGDDAGARSRIAGYAGGEDYHAVMLDRLRALADGLQALVDHPLESRCYVDTGPVMERVFAARAGIGWVGRNTLVIDRQLGSRMLLGVVLTSAELEPGRPEADHCGSCRACLDACPTGAFPEPYVLDARRCISYTTIEARGAIPEPLREDQGAWVFGCDVCQDVCPWNRRRKPGDLPDPLSLRERLAPDPRLASPALARLLALDEEAWREVTRGTALRRPRYRGLLRNALVAAGNSGDPALRSAVERHANGDDALLAEHARWALERLDAAEAGKADD